MSRIGRRDLEPVPEQRRRRVRDDQVLISRLGLHFPAALTYHSWERAGVHLSRILESSAWCLGDWLVCGQQNYADRYVRAIESAGLDYQTLRNYAWVARRFSIERRRELLSFQHHAEVASLDTAEQDEWLDRAEEQRWSRNELRRRLRAHRQAEKGVPALTSLLPRVPVARERVERWRAAAQRVDDHLENWMVIILDRAAEDVLSTESPHIGRV
ncbi:LmbU family transcriptional regulator [Umezawaea beigongshangensis]|uniref:LmbU family transcriptional regulator n=1 Tax=Umezawaea beigongshangensis TaxID=2780383 RepID=UPI0027DAB697|nr:LmbU family transcriptional regulator [Umezawaea beigongshangensis]